MIQPPVYNCPPPNEDLNSEHYDAWLNNVLNDKHHLITAYHHPDPAKQQFQFIDAWDGVILTQLLRQQKPLVSLLERLQKVSWSIIEQKYLKKYLLDFFNQNYFQHVYNKDINNAIDFFKKHETYQGEYRSITLQDVASGVLPSLEDYIGDDMFRAGKRSFEQNITFVTQWCMNNFSYHREEWTYVKAFEPIDISSLPDLDEKLGVEEKPKKLNRQEKLQEKLNSMTPEQRQQYFISLKIQRKIAALKRMGKIDKEVDEVLGIGD